MTNEERKALVERLVTFEQWLYDMDLSDLSEVQPNLRDVAKQIEADGQRIAELEAALTKSEALQDLAYYNGAKQYAVISAQSEDAARAWLAGGCGNRQHDAVDALGRNEEFVEFPFSDDKAAQDRAYWYRQGKDDGIEQERGNVIEWLRGDVADDNIHSCTQAADAIEAGEHLR